MKITEENFFEILEKISNKRYEAMDEAEELFKEIWATKDTSDLSDSIWGSLALELFLCDRPEYAIKAMLEAIKISKELENNDDKPSLIALYGDLSMFYESLKDYSHAIEASIEAQSISISTLGRSHVLTKIAIERVKRLQHFQSFKEDDNLKQELLVWFKTGSQKKN